ncbi:ABC transporter permease [Dactylosporangium sp. NPDC000555]|uniref:ABC transporter permease n=1 Tax=Dactylosporangium sp. NPDC000555 TaxID=3154260 RepID=UPI003319525F
MARLRGLAFKLLQLLAVLIIAGTASFGVLRLLPGDPAVALLGENATPEAVQALHQQLLLDRPLPVQYYHWVVNVLQGDLGDSARNGQPVLDAILNRLPVSIELMILAQVIALLIAIPLGVYGAYRAGGPVDRTTSVVAFGFISIPDFVLGIVLIFVVALKWGLAPATGWVPLSESLLGNLQSVILPAVTLAIGQVALYQRILRSDVIATLQEDFIGLARTKGLGTMYLLFRHALRPSSVSLVTLAGVNIGRLIGGAVVVEVLFALPGVGQLMVQSLSSRDYLMVQGVVLCIAVAYVVVNAAVDLLYRVIDPRVRTAR